MAAIGYLFGALFIICLLLAFVSWICDRMDGIDRDDYDEPWWS